MHLALGTLGLVALAAGGLLLLWVVWTFNAFVRQQNRVREAFSGVDVQLVRRHDLVPNLVRTVQGYAAHEREALEEVLRARGAADEAEGLGARARSENGLSRSIDRLFALVEKYPDLKADANFRKLHHDLVGIEDELQYARRYYNGTVRELNTRLQQFPANLLAGVFGVRAAEFFEVEAPSERQAPSIAFPDGEGRA